MEIKTIGIIGTGLMGKGICHAFVASGYRVDLFGRRDDIKDEIVEYFNNEENKGRITDEQKNQMLSNITVYNINSQPERLIDSDIIIETVKEDFQTKKEVLEIADKYSKADAILVSNTSSYSITNLAELTSKPENFVGMHFFSPVSIMKLVEVVKGKKTGEAQLEEIYNLAISLEKVPVKVKDSPGFVLNRGLFTMINEAIYMLDEGVGENAENIDRSFINGMGMKVGPLKLADLVGIDVTYMVLTNMYEGFKSEKYKPCPLLERMLDEGSLGKKAGKGFYIYKNE